MGVLTQTHDGLKFTESPANISYGTTNIITITSAGNVGIGTTSPSKKLEVNGSFKLGTNAYIEYGGVYPYTITTANTAAVGNLVFSAGLGSAAYESRIDLQGTNVGTTAGITLSTASSARLVVTNNGNVGIGTTSPAALLDVYGTFNATGVVSGAGLISNKIGNASTSGTGWFKIAKVDSRGGGVIKLSFTGGSYGPVTYVIKYHKDWASTTTLKLEKYGANNYITDVRFIQDDSDSKYYIEFLTASDSLSFQVYHDWTLGYNASTTMYTDTLSAGASSGTTTASLPFVTYGTSTYNQHVSSALGIGTASPLRNLHVVGNFAVNGASGQYYGVNIGGGEGSNPYVLIGDWHNASANLTWDSTNRFLRIDSQYSTSGAPIVFSGNDGAIEYMRITSAGNVGIGTTSPNRGLTISRSNEYASLNIYKTNTTNQIVYLGTGSSGADDDAILQLFDAATEKVRVFTAGNSWFNGGNVGIGTTSPGSTLDVVSSGINIYRATDASGQYRWRVDQNFDMFMTNSAGVDKSGVKNDGSAYFLGSVGIGTTNPTYKLDVYGDIRSGGADPVMLLQPDSGTYTFFQKLSTSNGDYLRLYDGTSYSMFWKGGNVGIGTTNPGALLDLRKDTNSAAVIRVRNANGGTGDYAGLQLANDTSTNGGGIIIFGSQTAYTSPYNPNGTYVYSNRSGGISITSEAAAPVYIATSNLVRLYVKSDGNVGIGTTSPGARLHVNGSFKTTLDGTYDMGILNEYVSTYVTRTRFGRNASGSSSNLEIYYDIAGTEEARITRNYPNAVLKFNKGSDTHMIINASGNVGIGTTSPAKKLDVRGGYFITSDGGTNEEAFVQGGSGYAYFGNYSTGKAAFGNSENWTTLVADGGNVGIGTTSPSTKLHVYQSGAADAEILVTSTYADGYDAQITLQNTHTGGRSYEILSTNNSRGTIGGGKFVINDRTADDSAARLVINSSGNVAIGSNDASYKLDVSGGIRATDYFISSANSTVGGISNRDWVFLGPQGDAASNAAGAIIGDINGAKYGIYGGSYDLTFSKHRSDTDTFHPALTILGSSTTDSSPDVYITNSLGIGTNSPSQKLSVYGNIYLRGSDYITWSNGDAQIDSTSYHLRFHTYDGVSALVERMRITSGGNVGFGTTSPSYKIDVSGGAIAIRGNAAGNSLRFDDSGGTSRNAMYVDTSNYLNIGNSNYSGLKLIHSTTTGPNTSGFGGQDVQQAIGTVDDGTVLAAPAAWLEVRVGTTDYVIPMYTTA